VLAIWIIADKTVTSALITNLNLDRCVGDAWRPARDSARAGRCRLVRVWSGSAGECSDGDTDCRQADISEIEHGCK